VKRLIDALAGIGLITLLILLMGWLTR